MNEMSILTEQENELLNLIYVDKMTIEQIAKKRNMHPKFVERIKEIALEKLRNPDETKNRY